eukprot:UN04544
MVRLITLIGLNEFSTHFDGPSSENAHFWCFELKAFVSKFTYRGYAFLKSHNINFSAKGRKSHKFKYKSDACSSPSKQ